MRRYRIAQVHGDRYGGEWVADSFRKAGIYYAPTEGEIGTLSGPPAAGEREGVFLLDDDRLVRQLISLERRTGRGLVGTHRPPSECP